MFSYRIWICWDLSRICLASIRKLGLKVANRFKMWKNSSNDESVELNMAISQINSQCTIFDKKITENGSEQKSWELTVCNRLSEKFPNYLLVQLFLENCVTKILTQCRIRLQWILVLVQVVVRLNWYRWHRWFEFCVARFLSTIPELDTEHTHNPRKTQKEVKSVNLTTLLSKVILFTFEIIHFQRPWTL